MWNTALNSKQEFKKLVVVVTKQNLIMLRCSFAEAGKEMYQEYSHCSAH